MLAKGAFFVTCRAAHCFQNPPQSLGTFPDGTFAIFCGQVGGALCAGCTCGRSAAERGYQVYRLLGPRAPAFATPRVLPECRRALVDAAPSCRRFSAAWPSWL